MRGSVFWPTYVQLALFTNAALWTAAAWVGCVIKLKDGSRVAVAGVAFYPFVLFYCVAW
jgi:hypothetical protein